jgi:hypothetical protein
VLFSQCLQESVGTEIPSDCTTTITDLLTNLTFQSYVTGARDRVLTLSVNKGKHINTVLESTRYKSMNTCALEWGARKPLKDTVATSPVIFLEILQN